MPRKILIVDDAAINRQLLCKMLRDDYEILEAENGEEALAILNDLHTHLSAVLLDIVMPVMDGYGVLEQMRENPSLSSIPVIVTTGSPDGESEIKALSLGANDFIAKPYVPEVIKRRLQNTIKLRETAAAVNLLQRDRLTGLYNRETFFQIASELIHAHPAGHYVMACFDINNFKIINDQYGNDMGDEVLKQVANVFKTGFEAVGGVVGRIMADNFAVLYPASFLNTEELIQIRNRAAVLDGTIPPVSFSIGRYEVDDLSLSVSAMYDRAAIAEATVKGRVDTNIAAYDETMRERILHEQEIANEMKQALTERQFEVWLQPQYNHSSGALIGAEALVRWRHPKKGLVFPGDFIPVFERNGFIYELDKFVWEETCVLLRKWLDAGVSPLPVSVNVSRYDVFRDDLIETITGLVRQYEIPIDLLRLEITESAFAKSTEQIIKVVKSLIDYGFTMEIDDFGSGYSSLNTLKDVPAQIVKLDMRFLESSENTDRGGNILESIVRMTKWLGMSVIAEGVETREQADYLKSIGCNYVQGYLYAKPMPTEEYEALVSSIGKEEKLLAMETVENLDNNAFWNPRSMDTLIFNTYVGGACIFEWHNERIEVLRANEKYAKIIGGENCTVDDALNLVWEDHMDETAAKATRDAIERTIRTGEEATYEAVYHNLFGSGKETWLRTTFRVIARTTSRYLLYSTNINLTAQREAELKERAATDQMKAIMANISGGVTAVRIVDDNPRFVFANEEFFAMLGYTKEQYETELTSPFDCVHPDDRARVIAEMERAIDEKVPLSIQYRSLRRDGTLIWVQSNVTITTLPGIDEPVQLTVNTDITAQVEAERNERRIAEQMQAVMQNVSCGVTAVTTSGEDVRYLFANDRYYEMFGYTREQYNAEVDNTFDLIHPDDRQRVLEAVERINATGRPAVLEYRVICRDGRIVWERNYISVTRFDGIDAPVQLGIATDITKEIEWNQEIRSLNDNLQTMMDDTPGGFVRLRVLPDGFLEVEYINETFCILCGASTEELMETYGSDAIQSVHPDDREQVAEAVAESIRTGETHNLHYRIRHANGGYVPFNVFGRLTRNEAGDTFINAYFADMSEREKRDLTMRETMPYVLSAIMKYSTDLVFAKDKDFRYICCSPAFVKFTRQKSEKDVIGRDDYEFWTKEEADHFRGDDMQLYERGEPLIDYIEPIPSDDGIQHYCRTSKYILRDSTGEVIGMYGIGRDITAERTTAEQLTLLTNSIPGGLAAYEGTPGNLRITYFNDGFCKMMGYTREEYEQLSADNTMSITFAEDVPALKECVRALMEDDTPLEHTYRIHCKDGGFIWVNVRGVVSERRGDVCHVNVVLFDVTNQKLAEEAAIVHEQEMRLAISKLGKMICEYNPSTRVLTVPESFAKQYNMPSAVPDVPESLIQAGAITEDTVAAYRAFFDAILRGEPTGTAEYCDRLTDGGYRWERVEFSTIFDSNKKPVKTIIAVEDTTQQHLQYELERNRPSLGEENLLVHALFNLNTGETLDYAYRDGREVPPSERTAFLFAGENLDEIIINEEERERYRELNDPEKLLARFNQGETELSIDYRRRMPDGAVIWVRNLLHMVREPGGSDVLLFEYCYNIETEKTRELMYGTLVNENYDYVARINGISRRFAVVVNTVLRDDLIPQSGEDFDVVSAAVVKARVHPDDREMVLKNVLVGGIKRNLENDRRFSFTFRILMPDGQIRYKRITQYYLDRERDIIIFTREDVTALMREEARKNELLESALKAANEESRVKEREAAERLALILNNVNGGMSATTLTDGRVQHVFANEKYYSLFGYEKEEYKRLFSYGMRDLIYPDDLDLFDEAVRRTATYGSDTVDVRAIRSDGSVIWVRNISSACRIDGIDSPVYVVVSNDVTAEREAADKLRMSEEQFRVAALLGGTKIARYDIKTGIYLHNDEVLRALGFADSIENMPEAFINAGIITPESIPEYRAFYDKIKRGEQTCELDATVLGQDGEIRWIHASGTVIFDASGEPSQAIIIFTDNTEQREKEAVYRKWQQSLQQRPKENYTLFRYNLSKDIFEAPEGSLLHMEFSPSAVTFNDRTREHAEACVYSEDVENYLAFLNSDTLLANYHRGVRMKTLEYREVQPDNTLRWLRLTVELVEYPNSTDIEAYLMFEDIDDNKRDELRNKERAETDPLTGVLNRAAFSEAVEHMIAGPNASGSLALLMLDIDGFKLVNDTFGHAEGDRVLIDIANALRSVLRHGDVLGRLGGDEFLICLPDMSDDDAIGRKAGQICALLYKALSLEVYISTSIGIVVYPRDGKDFETLYRKMDAALYAVKDHGKNNYAFYRESMQEEYAALIGAQAADIAAGRLMQRKKRRMLIVDDSHVSIVMLKRIFEDEFIIETAQDGGEALACLQRYGAGIAVVLLDLVMPGMDGFAVLSRMRDSLEMRTIPVIVVSGTNEYETGLQTIRDGAADFVTKPVDADLIRLRVQSVISKTENDRLRAQNNLLLMHSTETAKYRTALESAAAAIMEYDPASETFFYDSSVARHIAGRFDERTLWEILLSDKVASDEDIEKIRKLVSDAETDDERLGEGVLVMLRTPSDDVRPFRVYAKKRTSAVNLPNRIIITCIDVGNGAA